MASPDDARVDETRDQSTVPASPPASAPTDESPARAGAVVSGASRHDNPDRSRSYAGWTSACAAVRSR